MSKAYFWSLVITSHLTSVCLWSRDEEETSVEIYGPEVLWEKDSEIVESVDTGLTEVAANVPEEAGEPTKTVFGVLSTWVSEGHIKKEYLSIIREICGKLSLSPVGFVVVPEAISHQVKQNEGGPLSGVVLGIAKSTIEVTLFRLGNLAGTIEVGRSVSLTEDLIEALSRFQSNEPLPSRFILYGAPIKELKEISHLLSSVTWKDANEKLSFLHEPKIELASTEELLSAVSLAGSSEMGPVKAFVTPEKETIMEEENIVPADKSLNELGFAIDSDITKITPQSFSDEPVEEEVSETPGEEELESQTVSQRHGKLEGILAQVKLFPQKIKSKLNFKKASLATLPVEKPPMVPGGAKRKQIAAKKIAIAALVVLLLLAVGAFAALYSLPRAEITIFISPRTLTTHDSFALAEDRKEADLDNKVLPVSVFTKEVAGEDSAPASGSKTVGEKANGKVTIRNGTANGVKLPSGALLVGPNDLKFSINESASVSAAQSPTTPGTVSVSATAMAIGEEYNLATDTTLKVGSFLQSEIDAVVSDAFSGGSSRKITAVSKADLDALEKSLLSKLTAQAQEEVSQTVPDDYLFIPDSVSTTTASRVFDHKVGDEASDIGLNLKINATSYAIPKEALKQTAQKLLASQVPSGYSFRPEQVESTFEILKTSGSISASIGLTAHLLPNVNPDDVSRAISGKKINTANNYLGKIPGFVRASITTHPSLPEIIRFLPFMAKHITVSIEAEK